MSDCEHHDIGAGVVVRVFTPPRPAPSREAASPRPARLLTLFLRGTDEDASAAARTCEALATAGDLVIVDVAVRTDSAVDDSAIHDSAIHDSDRALQWARSVARDTFGADPGRIGVLDGPRTEGLAAGLAARVRQRHEPAIVATTLQVEAAPPQTALTQAAARLRTSLEALDVVAGHGEPAIAVHRRIEAPTLVLLDHLTRWNTTSIDTIRASYAEVAPPPAPVDPRVERRDEVIAGSHRRVDVPVRWYRPREATGALPALVYFHGGAFIMGSLAENDERLDRLAAELGCAIVSVDYRLAPEHPYPAGLDDAETVWRHVIDHADALDLDPSRLVIGGASAGAGLAAALCVRLAQTGLPQPALQLLVYPMLDDREHPSVRALEGGAGHWGLWRLEAERHAWAAYLGGLGGATPPATAVPGRATPDELRTVAPAFVGVGDVDALLDSNLHYAAQLSRAGVPVELHVYPGVIHGGFVARPQTPGTQRFLDDVRAALRTAFAVG